MGHRILTEARTFTAEERRAGDLDPATRGEEEGATGGEEGTEVEEEGTEGTGAPRTGSPETEETSEDGETTGELLFSLNVRPGPERSWIRWV